MEWTRSIRVLRLGFPRQKQRCICCSTARFYLDSKLRSNDLYDFICFWLSVHTYKIPPFRFSGNMSWSPPPPSLHFNPCAHAFVFYTKLIQSKTLWARQVPGSWQSRPEHQPGHPEGRGRVGTCKQLLGRRRQAIPRENDRLRNPPR